MGYIHRISEDGSMSYPHIHTINQRERKKEPKKERETTATAIS